MKAIFGSAVKKPLMTKVSMRHLNEIVRERNQYSRDAMEAWQDFINLKTRMDGELSKVTKRNNFLVDELESWKQQVSPRFSRSIFSDANVPKFLKFQAFAEQLTKETQELKVKIENHKREHRRLTSLIEQQKDDAARLTVRLSDTEKQRDDTLEALILQQEMAEGLERERKRNKRELSALQHTNATIVRQRDESQRVVLHLRSLIDGQTHHMEHIIHSLNKAPELREYISEGYEDGTEDNEEGASVTSSEVGHPAPSAPHEEPASPKNRDTEHVTPEMESRFFSSLVNAKPGSRLSIADVADRHLRDKTDAIADIIRNISDQCAAAVEGLQLAHDAEEDTDAIDPASVKTPHKHNASLGDASLHTDVSQLSTGSEVGEADSGHGGSTGHLTPNGDRETHSRGSDFPPTPDLIGGRSSTSMSGYSASTGATPDRGSQQWHQHGHGDTTKIVEAEEMVDSGSESGMHADAHSGAGVLGKNQGGREVRPLTARIVPA